jgi:hypothetical protein
MAPVVIVPDALQEKDKREQMVPTKPVIADAGSIIRRLDQNAMYRDRVSPITHRADEVLVLYGPPKKPRIGWLADRLPKTALTPTMGPTFLATTKAEDQLSAWDRMRLKIALARKRDPSNWFASWLVRHGLKHQRELREVTRFFGGKAVLHEPFDARCARLFSLVLHTELDMATAKKSAKKGKSKKTAKTDKKAAVSKKTPKAAKAKKGKASKNGTEFSASSHEFDGARIFRVSPYIKENPYREGTGRADRWALLKKGMTVEQFVDKGGSRGAVKVYMERGWIKPLKLKKSSSDGDE